jgi:hypothetical protein
MKIFFRYIQICFYDLQTGAELKFESFPPLWDWNQPSLY